MSLNRYAKQRDKNEPEIIEALRSVGALVWTMDVPVDLLVGFRGRWLLMEVKMPAGPKGGTKGRNKTELQADFFAECEGRSLPAYLVRSPMEALRVIGVEVEG